jgi:uncharacterized Tic20 family protein
MEQSDALPTSDEKLISAIAYFFGILGALFVWIFQKDKSRFVRFHAAQALAFDFLVMGLSFLFVFCLFGVIFIGMFGSIFLAANTSASSDLPMLVLFPALMPFLIFSCVLPLALFFTIIRLIATVSVLSGSDFRYPWLGRQVEKYLGE